MKKIFNAESIKNMIPILIVMLVIKLIYVVITAMFLPSSGQELLSNKKAKALYYRLNLSKNSKSVAPKVAKVIQKPQSSINSIKLLAIYNSADRLVVTVQSKAKIKVLAKGEEINGFTLSSATRDYAIFTKNGKSYTVQFIKKSKSVNSNIKSMVREVPQRKGAKDDDTPAIVDDGYTKIVKRGLLQNYKKDSKSIWKDIGINAVRNGDVVNGFKVKFVKKGSDFEKLGIQRGDTIMAVNGEELDSYSSAVSLYKEIDTIENLTLTIKRRNKEMELEYEIK
jgi:general secretion pathway protein C